MYARALAVGAVAAVLSGPTPTPVGTGPRYHPPARTSAARFVCRRAALDAGQRVHVELFAHRRVVIVPAAIGVRGSRQHLGRVVSARCRARAWTLDPSGIVGYRVRVTLGRLFRIWGQPLGRGRLASFRGAVGVYVNGHRRRGDPRSLRLKPAAEIVLEVGGYVRPHRSFLFPPR